MTAIRRARNYSRRRRYTVIAGTLLASITVLLLAAAGAFADAGNPILNTIKASAVDNGTTTTVFVRGQWNWLSHGSDCNFDRAGAGVGIIWDDLNGTFASGGHPTRGNDAVQKIALSGTTAGAHFTISFKNPAGTNSTSAAINASDNAATVQSKLAAMASIGSGNVVVTAVTGGWTVEFTGAQGLQPQALMTAGGKTGGLNVTITQPTAGVAPVYNGYLVSNGGISAYIGTKTATAQNPVDEMVHPDDLGNQVQGYTVAGTDYPATQHFVDPNPNTLSTTAAANWKGGCGRQPITATAASGSGTSLVPSEKNNTSCADGSTDCASEPWGSWGYMKTTTIGSTTYYGYSHTYLDKLSDGSSGLPDKICVNFYDVHGGGAVASGKFQVTNGANEITVDSNGDNSIDTNKFNVTDTSQGGNCIRIAKATITTTATSATIGSAISDTAHLTNVPSNAGGTITFQAWGPSDTTNPTDNCSGTPAFTSSAIPVSGPNDYGSGIFSPTIAGKYWWTASYSGDPSNLVLPAATACGDANETSVVGRQSPMLVTDARLNGHATVMLSSVPTAGLTDTATLSGGVGETGAITFTLYRGTCTSANQVGQVQVSPTNGDGSYTSSAIAITKQGLYRWAATFAGDSNNNGTGAAACGGTNEDIKVINPVIKVTKTPHSQTIPSGGTATWTITVTNTSDNTGNNPGTNLADQRGGLTDADLTLSSVFTTDAAAANCQLTSAQLVSQGSLASSSLSPVAPNNTTSYSCSKANLTSALTNIITATGTTTSGDQVTDNNPGDVGDRTGTVAVESLVTTATDATLGASGSAGQLTDSAVLSGIPANAAGHVTFSLYKRTGANPDCTIAANKVYGPTNGTPDPVNGPATYTSGSYTPTSTGTYDWLVTYSGDAATNTSGINAVCGDQTGGNDETSSVSPASPGISTDARVGGNSAVMLGASGNNLSDSVTITGTSNAIGGTVTFSLYRGLTCDSTTLVDTRTVNVVGDNTYSSGDTSIGGSAIHVGTQGVYQWKAVYSGDANNTGKTEDCGGTNETLKVINPAIRVTKTPHLQTIPSGGTATWTITVTNVSDDSSINPGATVAAQRGGLTDTDLTLTSVNTTDAAAANCQLNAGQLASQGSLGSSTLTPGQTTSYTCSLQNVTAAFDNIVQATGTTETNDQVSDNNPADTAGRTGHVALENLITTATDAMLGATGSAGQLSDSAALSGMPANAAGHVVFSLYKRTGGSPDCTNAANLVYGPVNGSPDPVAGPGTYTSGAYTPTSTGTYDWLVTYSGDAATNSAEIDGVCGDQTGGNDETGVVSPASPGISTDARVGGNSVVMLNALGNDLSDSATITGASNPTGLATITFSLYRGLTCNSTTLVDTRTVNVNGNGSYSSGDTTIGGSTIHVTLQGVYRWAASYSGDANNTGKTEDCGGNNEDLKVINPAIRVTKTPHSQTVPSGGTASWTITVRNASDDVAVNPGASIGDQRGGLTDADLTLTSVFTTDAAAANCQLTSADLVSRGSLGSSTLSPVPPNNTTSYTCSLANVTAAFDNIITATGTTETNNQVTDNNPSDASDRTGHVGLEDLTSAQDPIPNDYGQLNGFTGTPNGSMRFELFKGACTGTPLYDSGFIAVDGSGAANTTNSSDLFTLLGSHSTDGTYNWMITYSGDSNGNGDITPGKCGAENFTITNDGHFGN